MMFSRSLPLQLIRKDGPTLFSGLYELLPEVGAWCRENLTGAIRVYGAPLEFENAILPRVFFPEIEFADETDMLTFVLAWEG